MNALKLGQLLKNSGYPEDKTEYLVKGFTEGFDIGYRGPENVKLTSNNMILTIGNETVLWNKVMKEVKAKRFAGPFKEIPFNSYIQSPIGLVEKEGGDGTRLIFHLSHPRNTKKGAQQTSVNANIPEEYCSVKYPDFAKAIELCLKEGKNCHIAKTDIKAAFRNVGISRKFWKFMVLKAKSPLDGKWYYFFDKCLPFGGSSSCKIFQEISDSLAHLVKFRTKKDLVNYLDDFYFAALLKMMCDNQVKTFLNLCHELGFPVTMDKTYWGSTLMTFLGFLIDTINQRIGIPIEKINKAKDLIYYALNKKKITVLHLQQLCGTLNFFGRVVILGRAFTRRLYYHLRGNLKQHYHLKVTSDMKQDLKVWIRFLENPAVFNMPFMDLTKLWFAEEIDFHTDASKNVNLGFGGKCQNSWMVARWDKNFMLNMDPSIEYLELYAVVAGVLTWIHRFQNKRIIIFCDNISCCYMINKSSSKCKNCMKLIRIIVLNSLLYNVRIYARHIKLELNDLADSLSRLQFKRFWKIVAEKNLNMDEHPTLVPAEIWPMEKLWKV